MLITFAYRPGLISDDTKEEPCESRTLKFYIRPAKQF